MKLQHLSQITGHPSYGSQIRNPSEMAALIFVKIHWNLTENDTAKHLPIEKHWSRIYWLQRKWQNLLNFLQGAQVVKYVCSPKDNLHLPTWVWFNRCFGPGIQVSVIISKTLLFFKTVLLFVLTFHARIIFSIVQKAEVAVSFHSDEDLSQKCKSEKFIFVRKRRTSLHFRDFNMSVSYRIWPFAELA